MAFDKQQKETDGAVGKVLGNKEYYLGVEADLRSRTERKVEIVFATTGGKPEQGAGADLAGRTGREYLRCGKGRKNKLILQTLLIYDFNETFLY